MNSLGDLRISFRPLGEPDIERLRTWLREPHVAEFWQESENINDLKEKFLTRLPERGVRAFIIEIDGQPVGYIQEYEACKVGGGWWSDAKPGVFGIDQFIGDKNFIDKGFGTRIIKVFVERLFGRPEVKEVIVDPDPGNHRAIRAYEKVGFRTIGEIVTPGGPALLMRYV